MQTMKNAPTMETLQVKIGGMSCSFCSDTIRKAYNRVEGVQEVHVSLSHEETLIRYNPQQVSPTKLRDTLRQMGYTVRDPDKVRAFEEQQAELRRARRLLLWALLFTGVSLVFMALRWAGRPHPWGQPVMIALALLTVFGVGRHILAMAFQSLRRGILNQHVLLEFGAFAGLAGGALGLFYPDSFPPHEFFAVATFITTYHLLSGWASLLVRTRASEAVRHLMALQPAVARRVDADGQETEVLIETIQPGDRVRIRPGESLPVDGVVLEGRSTVDESLVTGEALPVDKAPGNPVIGGSINQAGALLIEATTVGAESFLARVARHLEEARAMKPGVLALVDRVLQYYLPGVLIFAGAAFLIWTLGAWVLTGQADWARAVFAALAALVMGYPCALGMATPLAMIRGGGEAAQRGILMRSGEAFQVFKDVRAVALDKTGTLTLGKPVVTDVIINKLAVAGDKLNNEEVLRLAAGVEQVSEHPLARAVVAAALDKKMRIPVARDFEALPGKGARANVDGETLLVGSPVWLVKLGANLDALNAELEKLQSAGKTVVVVAREQKSRSELFLLGLIAIADAPKADAAATVRRLKALGITPVMITGDNWRTARSMAARRGIEQVYAETLPGKKADLIRQLQAEGARVAMVGDGINDAPALMQADVGIAIGAGTDIAIESADVVLVGQHLSAVTDAYEIARRSYRKTVQNLILSFSFNGIGVPLAVTGLVPPVWAMVAMVASVSAVLLNSFGGRLVSRQTTPPAENRA